MSYFGCQHRSFLLDTVLIILVVLLLNSHVGLCSCYKRIFSFGDSTMDTGNFKYLTGKAPSKYKELPYGMTFFNQATGRMSDGRVLIDFYAEALQLPLIPPILPEKDSGQFPHGANFAVLGASTRGPVNEGSSHNITVSTPWSLGVQVGWFGDTIQRLAPKDGAKRLLVGESLIVMGEISVNDYISWFTAGKSRDEVNDIIPDVISYISHFVEELILDSGAKAFLIPNIFPIGCWASYLSRFHSTNPKDYDEHGCLRWLNEVSQKHNQALRWEINRLRYYHPRVKLIYADYYGLAMEFVKNPGRFGIIGDPLVACCGGDGPYHTGRECNRTAKVWGDPSNFANWDGMHLTEKAYSIIAQGVLNGTFTDPTFLKSC